MCLPETHWKNLTLLKWSENNWNESGKQNSTGKLKSRKKIWGAFGKIIALLHPKVPVKAMNIYEASDSYEFRLWAGLKYSNNRLWWMMDDGNLLSLRQKHEWHHSCHYRLQKLKVIVVATKYARRSNNGHPFSLFYAICHLWQQWDISFSNFINSSISGNNLMILKFWILLVPFWILKYGDSTEDLWKNSRPLFTSRHFEKNDIHRWQDRNNVGYGIIYQWQQGQEYLYEV